MERRKIHLDTDLGADVDDLCALAYLLRAPHVQLTGVTTSLEKGGLRSRYVKEILRREGRADIPVCSGADSTWSDDKDYEFTFQHEERMFGCRFEEEKEVSSPSDVVEAIWQSVVEGAVVAVIGPLTNIAEFEKRYPGMLNEDNFFFMGGSLEYPKSGWPRWGASHDWNIHMDRKAAEFIFCSVSMTLVPIPVTLKTFLTMEDCSILSRGDQLCRLLAHQGLMWREAAGFIKEEAARCVNLPDDLCNFHYDPLTVAIAARFSSCTFEREKIRFRLTEDGSIYQMERHPDGRWMRIVSDVDSLEFRNHWMKCVMEEI